MASTTTTAFAKEFAAELRRVPDFSAPSVTKFDVVRALVARHLRLGEDDVRIYYVSKPGNLNVRFNQPGLASKPKLGIALIKDIEDLDRAITAARPLVGPNGNVQTMALATQDGSWSIRAVIESDDGSIGDLLAQSFPGVARHRPARTEARQTNGGPLEALAQKLFVPEAWLGDVMWLLERKGVIFYGPPGTGKTYLALQLAEYLQQSEGLRTLVQFHPSYSYEDFFEGYRPVETKGGGLALAKRPGPLRLLAEAASKTDDKAVLVIDEINRGNLPKIFGELFFLLEYRDRKATLMYSPTDPPFTLPENLVLIGTMNTADRSIAVLDQALRRRFHFVSLFPGEEPVKDMLRRYLASTSPDMGWVAEVLDEANRRLGDRNVAIGPSHFMGKRKLDEESVSMIWRHSVLPTIEEHFFGDVGRLQEFDLDVLRDAVGDGSDSNE